MGRQEILELVEAIHPRIGNGVVGSGGGRGADCIADMSTRPELTTGVTSRQSTCEEGATKHLHPSQIYIYNLQSRLSDLILSPGYGPNVIIFHMLDGSRSFPQELTTTNSQITRTCRLLVRPDDYSRSFLGGSNADFHSPKGPTRMSITPSPNCPYAY
jgi:hypothetical protein